MNEEADRRHHDRRTPDRRRETLRAVPVRGFLAAAIALGLLFFIVWNELL